METESLITRITRIWISGQFLKTLEKRKREVVLIDQLNECVQRLFANPRSPGLNLETLHTISDKPVLSARINQAYRLVLAKLSATEVILLHFDNHDEAYAWVRHNERSLASMLGKVRELAHGNDLRSYIEPTSVVRDGPDSPIAIHAAEQFRFMCDNDPARYLAYMDDEQKYLSRWNLTGSALIKGGAGTGKTAVAVHRVLALAEQPGLFEPNRVLYLCYNRALSGAVRDIIRTLYGGGLPTNVEVNTFHTWGWDFLQDSGVPCPEPDEDRCDQMVYRAFGEIDPEQRAVLGKSDGRFVSEEIVQVIKHNGITSCEEYKRFERKGLPKLKLPAREVIWGIYERAERYQQEHCICRFSDLPLMALDRACNLPEEARYMAIVVDEGQDCSPVMIRLARSLLAEGSRQLTVFADPAQAIYRSGFQWTQDELRRSRCPIRWLRTTYRTTREIFDLAEPLVSELDAWEADAEKAQPPVRSGSKPTFIICNDEREQERELVARIVEALQTHPPFHVAVLASNWRALESLKPVLERSGVHAVLSRDTAHSLDERAVRLATMQSVKGLDFPCVFVVGPRRRDLGGLACYDLPETRRTLYVALTRASDALTLTAVNGRHHPLLEELEDDLYEPRGLAARAFVNLRGYHPDGGNAASHTIS